MVLGHHSLYSVIQGQPKRCLWSNLHNIHPIAPEIGLDGTCTSMIVKAQKPSMLRSSEKLKCRLILPSAAIFCMPPRSVNAVAPSCIWSSIFNLSTGAVQVRLIAPAMPAQSNSGLSAMHALVRLVLKSDVGLQMQPLQNGSFGNSDLLQPLS